MLLRLRAAMCGGPDSAHISRLDVTLLGYSPHRGDLLSILSWGSLRLESLNIDLPNLACGYYFSPVWLTDGPGSLSLRVDGGGDRAVPEPSTFRAARAGHCSPPDC